MYRCPGRLEGNLDSVTSDDFEKRRLARRERRIEDAEALREFRERVGSPHTDGLTPQAIHHWRTEEQIDALVEAGQSDPDLGFITALLATCSLPRTDPGDMYQYVRRNGPFTLFLNRTGDELLPYGILPRLILAWVCTEVVKTQSPTLKLGPSLAAFMRDLGVQSSDSGGRNGIRSRVRDQMHRLFAASIRLKYESQKQMQTHSVSSLIARKMNIWWQPRQFKRAESWNSTVELGQDFYQEIVLHPVPIDMNVLRAMKRSSLGVDIYLWLTYRMNRLYRPVELPWPQLYRQFGANPERATTRAVEGFRSKFMRELVKIKAAWPGLRYGAKYGRLTLAPSTHRIPRKSSTG